MVSCRNRESVDSARVIKEGSARMHWQMAGPAVVPSNLKPPSREHRRASWRPGRPRRRVTYSSHPCVWIARRGSGVNSPHEGEAEDFEVTVTDIVVGSREENNPGMLRLAVKFHDRLSSEIKDEICSKLASALRALKSRISRICGINELERRTQSLA